VTALRIARANVLDAATATVQAGADSVAERDDIVEDP
jgi:hypothetical protein